MTTDDICEIYHQRWGIETNYNTLKNRYYIENYTGKRRITIEQDIYSKFLRYNIFCHYKNYFYNLINSRKRKKGIQTQYQVNQANLIRKLKKIPSKNDSESNSQNNTQIFNKNNQIMLQIT